MSEDLNQGDDEKQIEQRGLYFEEFEVGVRYLHRPGRTITEGDNSLFTTLTWTRRGRRRSRSASGS